MRLVEGIGDLDAGAQGLVEWQRTFLYAIGQSLPFEVLQHQEVHPILASDVIERADVRVVQARDGTGLPLEAVTKSGVVGEVRGQDLDGHRAIETGVLCLVHLSHATRTDRGDDFVGTQLCAGSERHGQSSDDENSLAPVEKSKGSAIYYREEGPHPPAMTPPVVHSASVWPGTSSLGCVSGARDA